MEKIILCHPDNDKHDSKLWKKIIGFLKKNEYDFVMNNPFDDEPEHPMEGIALFLSDIPPDDFSNAEELLQKVHKLRDFLFKELSLYKSCLHFIHREKVVNGKGKSEIRFMAIDERLFHELTGNVCPLIPMLPMTAKDMDFLWRP